MKHFNRTLQHQTRKSGFTLIELLVVLGIIGILGSISYSVYVDHVKQGYRAEAQSALLQFQQAMERFFTENNTYVGTHTGGVPSAEVFPSTAPVGSNEPKYNLTVSTTSSSYTLTATPVDPGLMAGDGAYTLTNTGQKTYNGATGWD